MLIEDENWAEVGDSDLWHAAQGGAAGAAAELRRREAYSRTAALSPAAKARVAGRVRKDRS